METDLLIYGMKGSASVRKVHVLLAEEKVPHDMEGVNIFSALIPPSEPSL